MGAAARIGGVAAPLLPRSRLHDASCSIHKFGRALVFQAVNGGKVMH